MLIKGKANEVFEEVCEYLENAGDKEVNIAIGFKEVKEHRTLSQNSTWYRLFTGIGKHLGYDTQEVKIYFMIGCFGSKSLKLSNTEFEIPVISETHKLSKEQGKFLIDTLIDFTKKHNIPVEITPREIQSLYNSYN